MVEYDEELDRVFGALSDQTRRSILRRLKDGQAGIAELAEPFDMSLAAVSKHVHVLQRAGIVEQEKRGRVRMCALQPERLASADDWLQTYAHFWERRLRNLTAYLEVEPEGGS